MLAEFLVLPNCITIVTLIIKYTRRIYHKMLPVTNILFGQHPSYFCPSTDINVYSIMQKICSCYEAYEKINRAIVCLTYAWGKHKCYNNCLGFDIMLFDQ